jgi:hypothetical protein
MDPLDPVVNLSQVTCGVVGIGCLSEAIQSNAGEGEKAPQAHCGIVHKQGPPCDPRLWQPTRSSAPGPSFRLMCPLSRGNVHVAVNAGNIQLVLSISKWR